MLWFGARVPLGGSAGVPQEKSESEKIMATEERIKVLELQVNLFEMGLIVKVYWARAFH